MTVLDLTVAVLTYQRPADLADLVPRLVAQAQSVDATRYRVGVLVVDNDPDAGARPQVEAFAAGFGADRTMIRYQHEPLASIAAARNRALNGAAASDLLVFIDDDERPTDAWLTHLLECWNRTRATAVVGPVVSTFAHPPSDWVTAGRFFSRRRLPTGTALEVAATNNLLLDLREIRALRLRFDDTFGTSGGEDTLFTRALRASGAPMVWCDEAIVTDVVPAHRLRRRWVTMRALSSGNSWALTSVHGATGIRGRAAVRVRLHAAGLIRVAGGVASVDAGILLRRQDLRARGVRTTMRGLGLLSGAWGYRYEEYRRPPKARK